LLPIIDIDTLSTGVRSQNWMAACWASTKQKRMSSAGWRWRRRRHSRNETIDIIAEHYRFLVFNMYYKW